MFLLNHTALLLSHTQIRRAANASFVTWSTSRVTCWLLKSSRYMWLTVFSILTSNLEALIEKLFLPIDILCLITVQVLRFVASMPSGTIDYAMAWITDMLNVLSHTCSISQILRLLACSNFVFSIVCSCKNHDPVSKPEWTKRRGVFDFLSLKKQNIALLTTRWNISLYCSCHEGTRVDHTDESCQHFLK